MKIKKMKILLVSCLLAFSVANTQAKTVPFNPSIPYNNTLFLGTNTMGLETMGTNVIFNSIFQNNFSSVLISGMGVSTPAVNTLNTSSENHFQFCTLYDLQCPSFIFSGLEPGGDGESLGTSGEGSGIGDQTLVPGSAPVPIPAAAWLFGSALISLLGVGRRMCKS